MSEKFSRESYQRFLANVQNLYGMWALMEIVPIEDREGGRIHDCSIESDSKVSGEDVGVSITVDRMTPDVLWGFEFEWQLSFRTGNGRSSLSLAVQLGALLLATQSFRWFLVIDRDSCLKNEAIQFRSKEEVADHIQRVFAEAFPECGADLKGRGVLDEKGYLILPS